MSTLPLAKDTTLHAISLGWADRAHQKGEEEAFEFASACSDMYEQRTETPKRHLWFSYD